MIMRNMLKCALGLLAGLCVLAGNAGAQFKNGSQAGVAADWTDGHHYYVSPARSGWAGDLGQDGAVWEGVARGREREYDHHFFR